MIKFTWRSFQATKKFCTMDYQNITLKLIVLEHLKKHVPLNIAPLSWKQRKVLMGIFNVSLINSYKNPCKMFSFNSLSYVFSYAEDNINKASLTLSVSGISSDQKQNFQGAI